ncbi:RGS domain [Trinorchestia longiramus]|nr:RGS domain [Trinorchestia longiramus]
MGKIPNCGSSPNLHFVDCDNDSECERCHSDSGSASVSSYPGALPSNLKQSINDIQEKKLWPSNEVSKSPQGETSCRIGPLAIHSPGTESVKWAPLKLRWNSVNYSNSIWWAEENSVTSEDEASSGAKNRPRRSAGNIANNLHDKKEQPKKRWSGARQRFFPGQKPLPPSDWKSWASGVHAVSELDLSETRRFSGSVEGRPPLPSSFSRTGSLRPGMKLICARNTITEGLANSIQNINEQSLNSVKERPSFSTVVGSKNVRARRKVTPSRSMDTLLGGAESGGSSSSSITGSGRQDSRKHSLTRHPHRRAEQTAPSDSEQAGGGDSRGGSSEGAPSEAGDRVQAWATSFEKLLEDPVGLHTFTEFLKKEYSHENIYFWTACERYRLGITSDPSGNNNNADTNKPWSEWSGKHVAAKTIYDNHLGDNASEPVNVDAQARQMAHEGLRQPTQDIFASAQKQVFNLMKFDSYSRFLKSTLYEECLERESRGEDVQFGSQESLDPNLMILPSQLQHVCTTDAQNTNNVSLSSDSLHGSYTSGWSSVSQGSLDHCGTFILNKRNSQYSLGNLDHDDSSFASSLAGSSVTNLHDNASIASKGSCDHNSIVNLHKLSSTLSPIVSQKFSEKIDARNVGDPRTSQCDSSCGTELDFETTTTRNQLSLSSSRVANAPDLKITQTHDSQNSPAVGVVVDELHSSSQERSTCETSTKRTEDFRDISAERQNAQGVCSHSTLSPASADEITGISPDPVNSVNTLSSAVVDTAKALDEALKVTIEDLSPESMRVSKNLQFAIKDVTAVLNSALLRTDNNLGPEVVYTSVALKSALGDTTSTCSSVPAIVPTAPSSEIAVTATGLGSAPAVTATGLGSAPAVTVSGPCLIYEGTVNKHNSAHVEKIDDETERFASVSLNDGTSEKNVKSANNMQHVNNMGNFDEKVTGLALLVPNLNQNQDTVSKAVIGQQNENKVGRMSGSCGTSDDQEVSSQNTFGSLPSIVIDAPLIQRNPSQISRDSRRIKTLSLPGNDDSDNGTSPHHSPLSHTQRFENFEELFDTHFRSIGDSKLGSFSSDQLECVGHSKIASTSADNLARLNPPLGRARWDSLGLLIADEEQTNRLIESNKRSNLFKLLTSAESQGDSQSKSDDTRSLTSFSGKNNVFKSIFSSFRSKKANNPKNRNSVDMNLKYDSSVTTRPYSFDGQSFPELKSPLSFLSRRRSPSRHQENKFSADVEHVESSLHRDAEHKGPKAGCPYIANMQRERSFIRNKKTNTCEQK